MPDFGIVGFDWIGQVFVGKCLADEEREFFGNSYKACRRHLAKIIEEGQASGEFRDTPPVQMGPIIQAAIAGLMLQWVFDPEAVDFEVCCQNLVEMLIRHTGI